MRSERCGRRERASAREGVADAPAVPAVGRLQPDSLRRALRTARSTSTSSASTPRPAVGVEPPELVEAATRHPAGGGADRAARASPRTRSSAPRAASTGTSSGRPSRDASWAWIAVRVRRRAAAAVDPGGRHARLGAGPAAVRPGLRDAAGDGLHERRAAVEPRADGGQHPLLPAPGALAPTAVASGVIDSFASTSSRRCCSPSCWSSPSRRSRSTCRSLRRRAGRCSGSLVGLVVPRPRARARPPAPRAIARPGAGAGGPTSAPRSSRSAPRTSWRCSSSGSLATELLFAIALGLFARSLGYDITLAELLVINISVSLLASFMPGPRRHRRRRVRPHHRADVGGHDRGGGARGRAALPDRDFYLPPLWGFFAMQWLQRNRYL